MGTCMQATRGGEDTANTKPPATAVDSEDIGDLISAAMEDSSPSSPEDVATSRVSQQPRSRKKIEVRMSGESVLMDFDSDSDNEEVGGARSKVSAPAVARGAKVISERGSIFSDCDEDDFCIVHTPTSTKVVSLGIVWWRLTMMCVCVGSWS